MTPKLKLFLSKVRRELSLRSLVLVDRAIWGILGSSNKLKAQTDSKTIVFFGIFLHARISRISKWLRREYGYKTILVCSKIGLVEEFAEDNFDQVLTFRNQYHALKLLSGINEFGFVHGFGPKSYFPEFIRRRVDAPFFYDMADVLVNYQGLNPKFKWIQKELPFEKSVIQNASGLVGQSLEMNVAQRFYHIKNANSLFFGLYCDNDFFQEPSITWENKEIHLVYVGGVAGAHRPNKQFEILKFHSLIEDLEKQKIHFHVYPNPSSDRSDLIDYEKLDKTNQYFHFHKPVSYSKLASEISQYDYGIVPFFNDSGALNDEKMKYATSLKIFNFLEAGLPIIISGDIIYQSWLATRGGAGVEISKNDISHLGEILKQLNYKELAENVSVYREKLSLLRNIPRLQEFYTKVIDKQRD